MSALELAGQTRHPVHRQGVLTQAGGAAVLGVALNAQVPHPPPALSQPVHGGPSVCQQLQPPETQPVAARRHHHQPVSPAGH